MARVAVVLIGDEILTGKFADENGLYATARLREVGAALKRLVVIPDEIDVIADEVRRCSASFDHVVTSGGVGPTHDDLTFEGIAAAFSEPLVEDPTLRGLLVKYGLPLTAENLRMARVPASGELVAGRGASFPTVRVRNVYVLPGVPSLFKKKLDDLMDRFAGPPLATGRVFVDELETDMAPRLSAVVSRHPAVSFGSYPRFEATGFKVIVTFESLDAAALAAAEADLREHLRVVAPPSAP